MLAYVDLQTPPPARPATVTDTMAVLSPMLAYVELQTPPPARTATVTDDINPG
eukprot:CAMPEP_0173098464 /NCGR_PEP_ID=MMETSP1102-20130122/34760_1 /TAXON_ID=49646 /ORGANISM="Geminigera sp., Strain Caron Lab Isolate" /LENGTH=52 /DNA_ID=CAMNT_0013990993 /DNA_START=144 /DNA_END=305 /DNA_ORIENTATION=-